MGLEGENDGGLRKAQGHIDAREVLSFFIKAGMEINANLSAIYTTCKP